MTNTPLIEYRQYTIQELGDWLYHNADNGLSDKIISRSRAHAIVQSPHAKTEDIALATAFVGKKVVGYTAQYAEMLARPALEERYFWGTTEWVDPTMRGKGIGYNIMHNIKEGCNNRYLASDSTEASIKLDQKQGWTIHYFPRYRTRLDSTARNIKKAIKRHYIHKYNNKKFAELSKRHPFNNQYTTFIDDETYNFICQHSHNDLFLRTQEMFNWLLQYSFMSPNYGDSTAKDPCEFGCNTAHFNIVCTKVYANDQLVGLYIYSLHNTLMQILYLYTDDNYKDHTFTSILNRIHISQPHEFTTYHKEFHKFTSQLQRLNSTELIDQIALTVPKDFPIQQNLSLQGGDGDMLT